MCKIDLFTHSIRTRVLQDSLGATANMARVPDDLLVAHRTPGCNSDWPLCQSTIVLCLVGYIIVFSFQVSFV